MANGGDPAFGRLAATGKNISHPDAFGGVITWLFVIPPLCLVILTRMGIPVSTSLLVLTAFKGLVAAQQGKTPDAAVDLFYGLVLLFFKVDYIPKIFAALGMEVPWPEKMPMSTTWVFLGLLAGREVGILLRLKLRTKKKVSNLIFRDAGKAFFGSAIAVTLALFLPMFIKPVVNLLPEDKEVPAEAVEASEAVEGTPSTEALRPEE